jgi:hypothetical protein
VTRTEALRTHLVDALKQYRDITPEGEVDYVLAATMDFLHQEDCALTGTGVRHFKRPKLVEAQVA